jgi:tetratricopeptide (TPR) repeat protein
MLLALLDDFPDFAPAHATLADIHVQTTPKLLGLPHPLTADARSEAVAIAERHLAEARRLAGETGEISVIMANLELARARSLDAALAKAKRATEMAPGSATAWQIRAQTLCLAGRDDEALLAIARAIALDPADSYLRWDRVFYLHVAGRQREALAAVREAELYGPAVYFYAALVHDAVGNDMEALRAWVAIGRRRGLGTRAADAVLRTAAEDGAAAGYAALLRAQSTDGNFEMGGRLAVLRLKAGDRHGAVRAMIEAPSHRRGFDILFHRLPVLAPLRTEPRLAYMFEGMEHPPGQRPVVVQTGAGRP